jgi:hypothetical protein
MLKSNKKITEVKKTEEKFNMNDPIQARLYEQYLYNLKKYSRKTKKKSKTK